MSTFDVNEYFKNVANTVTPINVLEGEYSAPVPVQIINAPTYIDEKAASLVRAVEEKSLKLQQRRLASQNSLVSRLDLNPYGDAAAVTNALAAPFQGAARVGLDLLKLPGRALTSGLEATGLYDYDQANRARANLAGIKDALVPDLIDQRARGEFSDDLASAKGTKEALEGISRNVQDFSFDQDTFNNLSTLATNAFAAAQDNKGAFFSYLAENAPQIALAVGMPVASLASNAGYAAEAYDNWNLAYVEKYKRQPSAQEKQEAAIKAAGLLAAEGVGDVITGGLVRSSKALTKPLVEASKGVTEQAFKNALLGTTATVVKSGLNIAGATALGAVPEAITEGIQTKLEGDLALQDTSAAEIYEGAAIGGLSGGSFAGGARALGETAKAISFIPDVKKKDEEFNAKVATGDISKEMSGNTAKDKQWGTAAEIVTLNALNTENVDKVNAVDRLDTEVIVPLQKATNDAKLATKEGAVEKYSNLIKETEAKIALVDDVAIKADLQEELQQYQTKLTEVEKTESSSKNIQLAQQLEEELTKVQLNKATLQSEADKQLTDENFVKDLNNAVIDATGKSTKKLTAYFARDVGLSPESIAAFEKAISDANTPMAVAKQLRVFSDYVTALNKAKDLDTVSTQSIAGTERTAMIKAVPGKDFKGGLQYKKAFDTAFQNKDAEAVEREVTGLNKFVVKLKNKAVAIAELASKAQHIAEYDAVAKSWKVRPLKESELNQAWLDNSRKAGSINTAFGIKGVTNLANKIQEDLSILEPIALGMAEISKVNNLITNVQETTQTQQTSKEESKSIRSTKVDRRTQQTSVTTVNEKIGEANGVQKQGQEAPQKVIKQPLQEGSKTATESLETATEPQSTQELFEELVDRVEAELLEEELDEDQELTEVRNEQSSKETSSNQSSRKTEESAKVEAISGSKSDQRNSWVDRESNGSKVFTEYLKDKSPKDLETFRGLLEKIVINCG